MKSNLDFQLSQRCVVFKLLMGFYSSVLADDDTKVGNNLLILENDIEIYRKLKILI
jgi:hypothetical protein